MHNERHVITYLIQRNPCEYYTGGGWDNNIGRACLYMALGPAEAVLEGLSTRGQDIAIRCVIQNKSFDYFDGERFVYDLFAAKLYAPEEADALLRSLAPGRV
jgi:hypothetical protein